MVEVRFAGAMLIGLSSLYIGVAVSRRIADGCRMRKSLIQLLKEIKRNIAIGEPLCKVFSVYEDKMLCRTGFLSVLRTRSDAPLYEALMSCREAYYLTDEERSALITYSQRLGKCADRIEEEERTADIIRLLEEKNTALDTPLRRKSELALKLGALAAAAAVVVFGL